MTPLINPETRSAQAATHAQAPEWPRLLASPRFIMLAALLVIGLVGMYLVTFLFDDLRVPWVGVGAVVLLSLAGLGMLVVGATSRLVGRVRAIDVVAATAAGAMAQFLTRDMGMPEVIAGSVIAVAVGIIVLDDGPLDGMSAAAAYAGACVGLLPAYVAQSPWLIIGASVLCGVLWSLVGPSVWNGIGGRIGLVAFIAGSAVYLLADIIGLERDHVLVPLRVTELASWAIVPVGAAAAVLTWMLVERLRVPFALASGGLSLVVCLPLDLTKPLPLSLLDAVFFGGTFVGGSSVRRLPNAGWVALAGLLYGMLMLHFKGPLTGHVGVIGATGAIACLAVAGLEWIVLAPWVGTAAERLLHRRRSMAP